MSARGGVFYAIKLIQDSFTTASLLAATCFSWAGVRWICSGIGLTRHQKDRQVANIQTDKVLSRGCLKFEAGVFGPNNSALALKLDYVPLWLAKIAITPKMERETPELAARLEQYQLRAKDVLAAAFLMQTQQHDTAHPPVKHRELTADDYIVAARLASDCRNERLPYVLGFLEKGGFEIPKVEAFMPHTLPKTKTLAIIDLDDYL